MRITRRKGLLVFERVSLLSSNRSLSQRKGTSKSKSHLKKMSKTNMIKQATLMACHFKLRGSLLPVITTSRS